MEKMDIFSKPITVQGKDGVTFLPEQNSEEILKYYNDLKDKDIVSSGMDCSEICEDFLHKFGGHSLLILSNNYNLGELFNITFKSGLDYKFLYHYAYVSNDGFVYDVFDDSGVMSLDDYLSSLTLKGNYSCTLLKEPKYLKCYL